MGVNRKINLPPLKRKSAPGKQKNWDKPLFTIYLLDTDWIFHFDLNEDVLDDVFENLRRNFEKTLNDSLKSLKGSWKSSRIKRLLYIFKGFYEKSSKLSKKNICTLSVYKSIEFVNPGPIFTIRKKKSYLCSVGDRCVFSPDPTDRGSRIFRPRIRIFEKYL